MAAPAAPEPSSWSDAIRSDKVGTLPPVSAGGRGVRRAYARAAWLIVFVPTSTALPGHAAVGTAGTEAGAGEVHHQAPEGAGGVRVQPRAGHVHGPAQGGECDAVAGGVRATLRACRVQEAAVRDKDFVTQRLEANRARVREGAAHTHQNLVSDFEGILGRVCAQDRQLVQRQTYDIITQRPIVKEPEAAPRRTRPLDTRQQHNIVTNLDHSEHHFAPPEERYALALTCCDCCGVSHEGGERDCVRPRRRRE